MQVMRDQRCRVVVTDSPPEEDETPAFALLVDAFLAEQESLRARLAAIGDDGPQGG